MKNAKEKKENVVEEFEHLLDQSIKNTYVLRLYVTGSTPNSVHAIANIKKICEEHLKGRYDLEVIDLYQKPNMARTEQIFAAPTLIKKLPPPLRRIIGNLSEPERVLVGLNLHTVKK